MKRAEWKDAIKMGTQEYRLCLCERTSFCVCIGNLSVLNYVCHVRPIHEW